MRSKSEIISLLVNPGIIAVVRAQKPDQVLPLSEALIAGGVVAIEMGANATDLKLTIHPHPTLSETLMESAEVFFGQATHVYRPKRGG